MSEEIKYEDKNGVIHSCDSAQIIPSNKSTKLVWTKCGIDVPANKGFMAGEEITCKQCLNLIEKTNHNQIGGV